VIKGKPLPYEVSHDPSYNEVTAQTSVVRLIPSQEEPDSIIIEGPCPRCRHAVLFIEHIITYRDASFAPFRDRSFNRAMREAARAIRSRDVEVICDCDSYHPERPLVRRGCGASWVLHVAWDTE